MSPAVVLCERCCRAVGLCATSRVVLGVLEGQGLREACHALGHRQADSRADRPTPRGRRVACRHRPGARTLVSHGLEPLGALSPTRGAWARDGLRQLWSEGSSVRSDALPGDARASPRASSLGRHLDPRPPSPTPSRPARAAASRRSNDRHLVEGSRAGAGEGVQAQRGTSGPGQSPPRGLAGRRQGADAALERCGALSALDL